MMKRNFIAALMGLTAALWLDSAAEAAKYRVLVRPADPKLRAEMTLWKRMITLVSDADCQSVRILSKAPTEPIRSTIKQVLWDSNTDKISVSKVSASRACISKAVEALYRKNRELTDGGNKDKLVEAIYRATRDKQKTLYTGWIQGARATDYAHVTVHDQKNNQIFSILAGYSN